MTERDKGRRAHPEGALGRAARLGLVAGLRSMMAPALLSRYLVEGAHPGGFPLNLLGHPSVLTALAVGELVGDKLPMTPARTEPFPLLGRVGSGALVGAASQRARGAAPLPGALVGASAALVGAFAGYYGRRALAEASGLPDPAVAVLEDALAFTVGRSALR